MLATPQVEALDRAISLETIEAAESACPSGSELGCLHHDVRGTAHGTVFASNEVCGYVMVDDGFATYEKSTGRPFIG